MATTAIMVIMVMEEEKPAVEATANINIKQ
jgi:hypothetical protein